MALTGCGEVGTADRPLEFVCEWSAFGMPETRAVIDGQLVLDAAGQSIRLWPENGS